MQRNVTGFGSHRTLQFKAENVGKNEMLIFQVMRKEFFVDFEEVKDMKPNLFLFNFFDVEKPSFQSLPGLLCIFFTHETNLIEIPLHLRYVSVGTHK